MSSRRHAKVCTLAQVNALMVDLAVHHVLTLRLDDATNRLPVDSTSGSSTPYQETVSV